MKKRNAVIRGLSVFLVLAMICTGVPVNGQEFSDSGEQSNTAESIQEQQTLDDVFGTDSESGTTEFSSEEDQQDFQDGEESEENYYIKGRPLTDEETEEQLEPFRHLQLLDPGPEVESDLSSVPAAWGSRVTYPEKFDLRDEGLVTSVKNQNPFGTCWAFGMAAVLENALLREGKGAYDLSEEHLSYFFSNRQNDPLGNTVDDRNTVTGNYHSIGGNDYMAAIFLSTWSGMTSEDDVPFPTDDSHTLDLTTAISSDKAYNAVAYLKNAMFSKYSETRMKSLLYSGHAVSIMLYMKESYVNADTAAYCYPTTSSKKLINHIVTVVGWDDTFKASLFKTASNVTEDGAWIVKNSWGESKGDAGYYYVSYQDPNISNLISADAVLASEQTYKNNYFYDGSSAISSIKMSSGQSFAAVYKADAGNGKQEALGEVNVVSMSDNAFYGIQVYTDLTDPSDPESGTAAYTKPYEFVQDLAGVQTISIPEVTLHQGSKYAIVITNRGSGTIQFGVEKNESYQTSGGTRWFTSSAGIEDNQTFYKTGEASSKWTDAKTYGYTARIKAHTRTLDQAWIPDTPVFQTKAYNSGYNLVSWNKISGVTGYYIYRKPASGNTWTKLATVKASTLQYKDSKVTANASYQYTVRAYYQTDSKKYTSKYTTGQVIKAAPALQKVASVKSENNGIRIRWTTQKKCDGYYIYRKKKGGSYQLIRKISNKNTAAYLDKNAKKGVSYYYAVRAYVEEPYGKTYSKYKSSSVIKRK